MGARDVIWRLMGERQRPMHPGPITPVIDYLVSRGIGAGWQPAAGAGLAGIFRGRWAYIVDPPIGGFAINDALTSWPQQVESKTVQSVEGLSAVNFFLPGVYRLAVAYFFGVTATVGSFYNLKVIRFGSGLVNPVSPLPSRAGGTFPMQRYSGTLSVISFEARFIAEEPWQIALTPGSAIVDADIMSLMLDVECLFPLDQPEGT